MFSYCNEACFKYVFLSMGVRWESTVALNLENIDMLEGYIQEYIYTQGFVNYKSQHI